MRTIRHTLALLALLAPAAQADSEVVVVRGGGVSVATPLGDGAMVERELRPRPDPPQEARRDDIRAASGCSGDIPVVVCEDSAPAYEPVGFVPLRQRRHRSTQRAPDEHFHGDARYRGEPHRRLLRAASPALRSVRRGGGGRMHSR